MPMNDIKSYYNGFTNKLILDYVHSNPRIEDAIKTSIRLIDFSDCNILDIGCGIGWSSFEFSKRAKFVQGIDISNNLIEIANDLFQKDNLKTHQQWEV